MLLSGIFKRGDDGAANERQRKIRLLTRSAFTLAMLFMGAVGLIYAVMSMILGSSLFIPRSADAVLDSINSESSYTWNSQTVRIVDLAGHRVRQDAARGAVVDRSQNKFQASVVGVLPERTFYVSDGDYAIALTDAGQERGEGWQMITDACSGAPSIPASTLGMPSAEALRGANPTLVSDEGTVFGERAWEIEFEATPQIIKQLLWLPFFEEAADEDQNRWVMSEEEYDKVDAGDFETVNGIAWVNRDGDRQIQQIDLKVNIEGGSKYRFLAQRVMTGNQDPLKPLQLGPPSC